MKSLREICIEKLRAVDACPICGEGIDGIDDAEERDFRSPDDVFAISFYCGAELSLTDEDQITSRRHCPSSLASFASDLCDEASEEFNDQEGGDT